MEIIRYTTDSQVFIGRRDHDGTVQRLPVASLAELLRLDLDAFRAAVTGDAVDEADEIRVLPPIDGLTEVWAGGVTYQRSSEARQEESAVADVYARVYDADRPELFFKSPAWRVCADGEPIGVRPDSDIDVPEPELALVINAHAQIVGLSVCNDVSSRTIEGVNPLYLPQAKFYDGACALGPGIRPVWEVSDPADLDVSVTVDRSGAEVWRADTSTALMHRTFGDLVTYLYRAVSFPDGAVLSTGTGTVPELDFTLLHGDVVTIDVAEVGTLRNQVRTAEGNAFAWLTPDPARAMPQ